MTGFIMQVRRDRLIFLKNISFARHGIRHLGQSIKNFEDAVAALDTVVHDEAELWGILQDNIATHLLTYFTGFLPEEGSSLLGLDIVPKHRIGHGSVTQIGRDIYVSDRPVDALGTIADM